ncbi:glutathione S-transferase [Trichoderma sp. SZMC 28014]
MGLKTDLTLYTALTPNGIKLYQVKLKENEQKLPWSLDINPNGRIPALNDKWPSGKEQCVFESGAILEYLVERYDANNKFSYPKDSPEYREVKSWISWQIGGLGPMQGQLEHFRSGYAAEKIEYGISRYDNETHRLYNTMETHLAKSSHGLLVGDRITIADIACLDWVANHVEEAASDTTQHE